jgi:hypothetical protein
MYATLRQTLIPSDGPRITAGNQYLAERASTLLARIDTKTLA